MSAEDWVTGTGKSSGAIYSLCGGQGRTGIRVLTHMHVHKPPA